MKVKYENKTKKAVLLKAIPIGAVFCPIDAHSIYMKLDHDGDSELLTNNCQYLWSATHVGYEGENFESRSDFEEEHDYEEFSLCADVESGEMALLYENIEVELLECELVINKER